MKLFRFLMMRIKQQYNENKEKNRTLVGGLKPPRSHRPIGSPTPMGNSK